MLCQCCFMYPDLMAMRSASSFYGVTFKERRCLIIPFHSVLLFVLLLTSAATRQTARKNRKVGKSLMM